MEKTVKFLINSLTKYDNNMHNFFCKNTSFIETTKKLDFFISGSCKLTDWIINNDFGIITNYHAGWFKISKIIYDQNKLLFDNAIKNKKNILIIGHSLGASISAYLINFILNDHPEINKKNLKGIGIASPRSISQTIGDKIYDYFISVCSPLDIVTYIPFYSRLTIPGKIYIDKTTMVDKYKDFPKFNNYDFLFNRQITSILRKRHAVVSYIDYLKNGFTYDNTLDKKFITNPQKISIKIIKQII